MPSGNTSRREFLRTAGSAGLSVLGLGTGVSRGTPAEQSTSRVLPTAEGFRGIWYSNQPQDDPYRYKYSGGMATFPQQIHPFAVYSEGVERTFFVWGGPTADSESLHHLISYYDHCTGQVARPRILLDKETTDAHDNPCVQLDGKGHIWIFSNAHGTARPAYIHRSVWPYDITAFEQVLDRNFSYGQPWYVRGGGFVFLHTLYQEGRHLHVSRSADGEDWSEPVILARAEEGHYQVSAAHGKKVGTVFNVHPTGKPGNGLNWRTNLYYMETVDGGRTWQTAAGDSLSLPLTNRQNAALALDPQAEDRLVYLKTLAYTDEGRPVALYLTSGGYASGPQNDPRILKVAHWDGEVWKAHWVTETDNNYDFASLYVEGPDLWRIIGTTEPGPQRYNTGGEVAMWVSEDRGETWSMAAQLTRNSRYNHTYPRGPVNAHPDFYALWADGHGRRKSESRLYFTDRQGSAVWRLPVHMDSEMGKPEQVG